MKRSRYTEEQIIGVLKEHRAGLPAAALCRKDGISEAPLYNWRLKYGGLEVSDARRLRVLEEENRKLKKLSDLRPLATVDVAIISRISASYPNAPTVNGMLTRWRHNSISDNKTQLGAQMPQPKHRSRNMLSEAETSFEDTVFRGFETWKG